MVRATFLLLLAGVLLLTAAPVQAETCSSSGGCADCWNDPENNQEASCTTVEMSASCECSLNVKNPTFCILSGVCTYTGGSGSGGSSQPGSGTTCVILAGRLCPAECESCTSVFWF
jgi:hypothetical protein